MDNKYKERIDSLLGTKFVGTCIVVLLAFVLVLIGKLDAQTWMTVATIGFGIYSGANVVQKFVEKE